ncbi:MAG: 4Fe-4S binding protein [Candidatus Verstraetearchaeota archaeon]|nr:4Fe-4S binding protein [Candidatus Verstraetearchaeota archaeon]
MSLFKEAIKQIPKKPVTIKYPFEPGIIPPGLRGLPIWDMSKCILCVLCQNACPVSAIKMIPKGPDAGIIYDLSRCIFCAECADACPKKAITITNKFELATTSKSELIFHYKKSQ